MKLSSDDLENLKAQVDSTPLVQGGSSFATHYLDCSNPERWIFKLNLKLKLFVGLFPAIGVIVMLVGLFNGTDFESRFFSIVFGGIFIGVSTFIYQRMAKKIGHFDFTEQAFWQGRASSEVRHDFTREKNYLAFADLAALQIVKEYCVSNGKNKSSYYSYELNLVTTDGRRINVVDHGSLGQLEEETAKLAEKLDLPVWEAGQARDRREKNGFNTIGQRLGGALFGLVFFAAGTFFEYMVFLGPYLEYREAADWEQIPAKVVNSELRNGSESGCYGINIHYSYKYEKNSYQTDNFDLFFRPNYSTNLNVDEMRQLVTEYPAGREFNCLVDPDN
ncbi:MAG: DUF3592 domain-containing protein, partial [Victivallaceae bacterium]